METKTYNVLFLSTGNSARSLMAEALLNAKSNGRFIAYSAGSHPAGEVNCFAREQIELIGHPTDGLRCKSWNEFMRTDSPSMDFIITVDDKLAGKICPDWPGKPVTVHWGFQNPAAESGSDVDLRQAFSCVCLEINTRLNLFISLPMDKLNRLLLD